MVKYKYIILTILIISLLSSCKLFEEDEEKPKTELIVSVFPDIGTLKTKFEFKIDNVIIDSDTITDLTEYKVRWDLNDDGTFDTDWLDSLSISISYDSYGKHSIAVKIENPEGTVINTNYRAYVQELIRITNNLSNYSQGNIDWSLDGSDRIAFDWREGGFSSDSSCGHKIWVMDYPGGIPVQVSIDPAHMPEWSPDGRFIIFNRGASEGYWSVNLETGEEQELFSANMYAYTDPRWSPDGEWLLFKGVCNGVKSTVLFNMVDSTCSSLFSQTYNSYCWSPDSKYFAGTKGITWENPDSVFIEIVELNSANITESYQIDGFGYKIDWSPDNDWISLGSVRSNEGVKYISLLNINTWEIVEFIPSGINHLWYPTWSSDGSLLAFEGKLPEESRLSIWAITFPEDL